MNYIDKKKPQCGNYEEEFAAFIPSQFILKSSPNFKWLVNLGTVFLVQSVNDALGLPGWKSTSFLLPPPFISIYW